MKEAEFLHLAGQYCFRTRLDGSEIHGPVLARGEGSVVYDVEGKAYLDFNSGQMCATLGHNHPRIVAAIQESCRTLIHANSTLFNAPEILLAQRLASIVPRPLLKSLFLLSGSDANEAAIGLAKKYTGGFEVISPHTSFHGLSDMARMVTYAGWHKGYGPGIPGTYAMLAPYCYRCPVQHTFPTCQFACLEASFELIDAQSTGALAAVITEPLFSAGGVIEPPEGWLTELQRRCKERGMLLILDEAQTGLAKLGTMWAFEREGIIPDILTISKHFGGGVTISAVVTTAAIEERAVERGFTLTHSHAADPLGCSAALASIALIQEEDLTRQAERIGRYWRHHLDELAQRYELIGDVRGRGLIQGIELVWDREKKTPAPEAGRQIARHALEHGLLFSLRRGGSVLRFVPPFTTTEAQMDQAATILRQALETVQG
ncbi:MAG: aspartate aminotransferase family protein [Nitrospinota bacterium]|nr:MAG: aspartate aminotransferase family protein [Nitrospinota bacterium]